MHVALPWHDNTHRQDLKKKSKHMQLRDIWTQELGKSENNVAQNMPSLLYEGACPLNQNKWTVHMVEEREPVITLKFIN